MKKIVIIADDLTGAADTGVQFCHFFEETVLLPYHQLAHGFEAILPSASQVLSIYTSSRAMDARAASVRVASVGSQLSASKSTWIYKKVDSCLRGNLGAEIEAVMDMLDFELSFIAPAFPGMGRTTVNDIHRVHGTPVSETEISRDPVTPITDSHVSRIIAAQSRYPVGHVALNFLDSDEAGLLGEIERQIRLGVKHVVFDTTSQEHLDRIARLVFFSERRILPVGSAGLATSLGRLLPNRNHLLVCGTASEVTKLQIKNLIETHAYEEVILEAEILGDQNQRNAILNQVPSVRSKLSKNNVVIRIGWPRKDDDTFKLNDLLRKPESIAQGLELFVASVLRETEPDFVFSTGGDTAEAVLSAVQAGGIRIFGEVVAGMVQGRILGGLKNGLPIVTKAGAFGNKDALVVLHDTWQGQKEKAL
jgi:uncharacterized protein YgbK (DUF1537 family)